MFVLYGHMRVRESTWDSTHLNKEAHESDPQDESKALRDPKAQPELKHVKLMHNPDHARSNPRARADKSQHLKGAHDKPINGAQQTKGIHTQGRAPEGPQQ